MTSSCVACGELVAAPGSGRPDALEGVRDPQSLEAFDIEHCPSCGLGQTVPVPADLGAYYGPAYYGKRHSFTDRYCFARRVRLLGQAARAGGLGGPGSLLDIGCGDGSFLAAARARGWKGVGTEIGAAAEASRAAGIEVRSAPRDFDDRFDAITMWHTLEHFPDPGGIVREAREMIAPRGTFIVAVPDAGGLQASLFQEHWFHLDVPRHLFHFSRGALATLLDRSGFAIERWHHQELELDLFGWIQSALNAVLPAPNVLFQSLTGKPTHGGPGQRAASYVLGTAIAPAAALATAVGTATRRGGTLVAVARPR
jgi:SAM-dependent methyltransferase